MTEIKTCENKINMSKPESNANTKTKPETAWEIVSKQPKPGLK